VRNWLFLNFKWCAPNTQREDIRDGKCKAKEGELHGDVSGEGICGASYYLFVRNRSGSGDCVVLTTVSNERVILI
jgi:uncharacterized low-complexity protein